MPGLWISFVVITLLTPPCLPTCPSLVHSLQSDYLRSWCDTGEFAVCQNKSICLERSRFCDGILDCPDGEDENFWKCLDYFGSAVLFLKTIFNTTTHPYTSVCELPVFPVGCTCSRLTAVSCKDLNLTEIPAGISPNVTKLTLSNNNITVLTSGAFSSYPGLKSISLAGNAIRHLPSGAFLGINELLKLYLQYCRIESISKEAFKGLTSLKEIVLAHNNLKHFNMGVMNDMPSLSTLDLSQNKLTLEGVSFPEGLQLKWLFLEDNHIATIEKNTFASLTSLKVLLLHNNRVSSIHREAFHKLTELIELNLSNNKIRHFPSQVFYNMCALAKLELAFNPLRILPLTVFHEQYRLKTLNLTGIEIINIDITHFEKLKSLEFLYFKKFHYCSFAPFVRICRPNTDGLSSTEHLLVRPVLRMSVWVVALVTCSGNSLVLFWRIIVRRRTEEYQITALFIKNLAVSDLLMGVYLVVIGAKDVAFRDEYNRHAHQWMSSWGCTACGVLAMVSCEVSILILTLMTMDRYLCFKCNSHRVTTNAALYSLAGIWLCGLFLALFPVIRWPHDRGFYSSNGLCFPLHIDDPYMLGWEFSTFVFLGVNFPAVLLMVVQYIWMFYIISRRMSKSQPGTLKPARYKDDTVVALRCFFIVLTDCLCWVPIVIIKIVALCEISISENLFAWIVVFIVPINSALNPMIYTFGYRAREMKRLTQGVLQWCHKPMEQVWGPESKASVATQSTTVIESRSVSSGSILPHNVETSITVDINKSVRSASEECHPLKGQETEL
ncbi:uncharacterized protein LOC143245043 [Tachypleus tridentatus]|uniref:uncharacterized protein LOC143245043 n=1 Tax=Tachypleus tridentatus TaxID=6853 RepID=UPI003FCF1A2D